MRGASQWCVTRLLFELVPLFWGVLKGNREESHICFSLLRGTLCFFLGFKGIQEETTVFFWREALDLHGTVWCPFRFSVWMMRNMTPGVDSIDGSFVGFLNGIGDPPPSSLKVGGQFGAK